MQKTTQYTNGVMAVTALARTVNTEIGSYQEHYVNENFEFSVRLFNGAINMSVEIAQDYEAQLSSVTPDRIANVAKLSGKFKVVDIRPTGSTGFALAGRQFE